MLTRGMLVFFGFFPRRMFPRYSMEINGVLGLNLGWGDYQKIGMLIMNYRFQQKVRQTALKNMSLILRRPLLRRGLGKVYAWELRRGIPGKTITLLCGLLIDEEQWKELVENGGGKPTKSDGFCYGIRNRRDMIHKN